MLSINLITALQCVVIEIPSVVEKCTFLKEAFYLFDFEPLGWVKENPSLYEEKRLKVIDLNLNFLIRKKFSN